MEDLTLINGNRPEAIYTIIALGITMIFFFPLWWSFSNSLRIPKETFTVTGVGIPFINFTPTLGNWTHQLSFPFACIVCRLQTHPLFPQCDNHIPHL